LVGASGFRSTLTFVCLGNLEREKRIWPFHLVWPRVDTACGRSFSRRPAEHTTTTPSVVKHSPGGSNFREEIPTPDVGQTSLLAFQVELADKLRSRYHAALFRESNGSTRLVVHRQAISGLTGVEETIESHSVQLETLNQLRIARRGEDVTILASSPEYGGVFVVAQFECPQPRLAGVLRTFLHAGSVDKEVSVRVTRLRASTQAKTE